MSDRLIITILVQVSAMVGLFFLLDFVFSLVIGTADSGEWGFGGRFFFCLLWLLFSTIFLGWLAEHRHFKGWW